MRTNLAEVPKHPLPHVPQPPEPQRQQPSTVFVYERQRWEYKVVSQNMAEGRPLTEDELNALGKNGWELVAVVELSGTVQFYFKRVRS